MPTNNRKKLLIIVAAIALALVVGDYVVVDPLWAVWLRGEDKITQLKKDVDEGNRLLLAKKSILGKWETMKTTASPRDQTAEETRILQAFDGWERKSNIKPDRTQHMWKPGDDSTQGIQYSTFEFRADVSGSMRSIEQFLYYVENDLRGLALKVDSMQIASHDNDGQTLTLALTLNGLVLGQAAAVQQ